MTRPGVSLFITAVFLSLFGIFILYESSTYPALLNLSDKYYFVKNQAIWFTVGLIACLIISRINYRMYYKWALPMLIGTVILLILVFIPGIGLTLKGASRWIDLGFIVIQPSEILKISLTVYLAAWLSTKEKGRFIAFLMLLTASVFLVVTEPDMGTGMIIAATATIVYFLSGAPWKDFAFIFLAFLIAVVVLIKIEPYRMARLTAYQNLDVQDLSTTSYHVKQILISLGSGGLTGVGLGKSVQKYGYLPESTTDSVFAIFAEETGFLGSVFLICVFGALFISGFLIAVSAPDIFGKLLAAGIITYLAIQAYVNLASQAVIIPLTGVPLPFISYGGSSLIINMVSIGVLLNIARKRTSKPVKKNVHIYKNRLKI